MVSDGGKGSARRKEDVSKIHDNWDRIFGSKKHQQEEKEQTMNDYEDNEDNLDEDEYDDDCSWCQGTGEGDYDGAACRHCHGTGREPKEGGCDDYDYE